MAEKINATCAICGKGYYKCISCQSQMSAAPWKMHTDTAEHYKVFQVIHGFNTGVYNKAEAKEKLQAIDLSDLNELRDNIKKIIKDIMKEDKKPVVFNVPEEADKTVEVEPVANIADMPRRKRYATTETVESVEDKTEVE